MLRGNSVHLVFPPENRFASGWPVDARWPNHLSLVVRRGRSAPMVRQIGRERVGQSKSWYALETRPAAEYVAETEIRRVGVEVYLPQFRREYRHHRSKKWIARSFPLFTGYLFIRADGLDWGALATCRGIERDGVLRDMAGKPLAIDGEEVDAIRAREAAGEFDDLRARSAGFKSGERVVITGGALVGREALVARVKSGRNVSLLLEMFGSKITVSVPVAKLARTG